MTHDCKHLERQMHPTVRLAESAAMRNLSVQEMIMTTVHMLVTMMHEDEVMHLQSGSPTASQSRASTTQTSQQMQSRCDELTLAL